MKEKTAAAADTEGHQIKVGLDQQKSVSSVSNTTSTKAAAATINSSPPPAGRNKESSGTKGAFLSPNSSGGSSNNNSSSTAANNNNNSSSGNNNFDDDYNEWDISIGDLIIDLDADIERQSEGEKSTCDSQDKADKPIDPPSSSKQLSPKVETTVMSSNFKSNRLNSVSSSSVSVASSSSNPSTSATTNSSSNLLSSASPATSQNAANGSNSGHHRHHHSHQRNNYSVAATGSSPNNSMAKSNSSIEHQAKSLKMKIKRKNIGGKISEINHEIVSSDTPPACKAYITTYENNSSQHTNNSVAGNTTTGATTHATNNADLSSSNSVITASVDGVAASTVSELSNSSKSSKHSSKNKSSHRDKKDKIRSNEKERHSSGASGLQINLPTVKSEDASDSAPVLISQTLLPDIYKYSPSSSSSVILKTEEASKSNVNLKKIDDKISERREAGTSTSIATITEPDCLGPCEPGTSVTLEGIVWQETEGGVLVVNVTWRGKTYVGTLLDCTKHDWAPPRFCESPTSDIDSKSLKNTRGKRARGSFTTDTSIDTRSVTSKLRNGKGRRTANSGYVPPSPAKSDSALSSSKRKGRPSDLDLTGVEDNKRAKVSKPDTPDLQQPPSSPVLIECPEPNCSKKYKHINGLKYHQSHAHFGSTFNINDSQELEPESAKGGGDASDSEFNESSVPDSPTKNNNNNIPQKRDEKANSDDSKAESNTHTNSHAYEKKLLNSANELLVSDSIKLDGVHSESKTSGAGGGEQGGGENLSELNHKRLEGDSTLEANSISDNSVDLVASSECIDMSAAAGRPKLSESIKTKELLPSTGSNSNSANNKTNSGDEEMIENVMSPTFSDISDDTNTNDNANELVNFVSTQPDAVSTPSTTVTASAEKPSPIATESASATTAAATGDSKKPANYNLFPPYFNKSQYLLPNNSADTKPGDGCGKDGEVFPFYRFGGLPNDERPKYPDSISRANNLSNSHSSPNNKIDTQGDVFREKTEMSKLKDSVDFNSNKQPIIELQNLKNRIPNYAFDQMPMFDSAAKQKQFFMEKEKSKEKLKLPPKGFPGKEVGKPEEKDKNSSKGDEGVKPTMETTGPPPPTNGYYYNPSFLSHSFPAISHFDSMFRGNAMNHVVLNPPYGPPPGSAFLQSQLRFGSMAGGLDGRTAVHSPSTSTKTTTHPLSSFNSKDRSMHSPSGNAGAGPHSLPSSYHKSPSKQEYANSINSTSHSVPSSASAVDQRSPMTSSTTTSSSLHPPPPRHPLHSTYPIYDPYSAMIVNHAANSVQMHPFPTPK